MKAVLLAAALLAATGIRPAHEPESHRAFVQSQMKLIGLCDWWLAWGNIQSEPVPIGRASQWDYTCRDYHTAKI